MASSNDFYNGMTFSYDGDLLKILEFLHVKPGKGPAFVRTKVLNLKSGAQYEKTFRGGEKVEQIRIEDKQMQYLYRDGDNFVFMDNETYNQVHIPTTQLAQDVDFLKENENIKILFHGEQIMGIELPQFMELKIAHTEPGARGNTVAGATKFATLETGAVVKVPLFVDEGEVIKVDTRARTYIERVRNK